MGVLGVIGWVYWVSSDGMGLHRHRMGWGYTDIGWVRRETDIGWVRGETDIGWDGT